ncbi:ATP-binding protein [Streptomyces viridosporus]|uniref:ATP-binding protein n=1 Tax=Streptomyces viridosporus TaxID=67581 RepID=UPI003D9DF71A
MVGEGVAGRSTRALRAQDALKTIAAGQESPEQVRRALEQALVFAGAAFAAVYAPSADGELLCLVESVGVPRTLCEVRDSYPVAGRSPAAEAHRGGRPVWLGPKDLAAQARSRRVPSRDFFLAALPLRDGGCLLAVSERPGGFDADGRVCLLDLTLADGRLRPAVADASPRTPVEPAGFGREATGGRGVPLVEALSAAWGTLPGSGGKQVGAEFVLRR